MIIFILFHLFVPPQIANAASCCGSNISAPALITTFEKYRLSISRATLEKTLYVKPDGQVIRRTRPTQTQSSTLRIGTLLGKSPYQLYAVTREINSEFGDSDVGLAHYTEFEENDIDTYTWLNLGVPTGKSVYEIHTHDDPITGGGVYNTSIGGLATKNVKWGDFSISGSATYGHPREIKGYQITPKESYNLESSVGFIKKNMRIGLSVAAVQNEGRLVFHQNHTTVIDRSQYFPLTFHLSYLEHISLFSISFSDETLIGPAQNTDLNRSVSLNFVHRWY